MHGAQPDARRHAQRAPGGRFPVANQWQLGWFATAFSCAQLREDKRKSLIYNGNTYPRNSDLGRDTPFGT